MMDLMEGYLNNISAAATKTADQGGHLTELAASLAVSVDNVARQKQGIKRLTAQFNAFKKKVPQETSEKERERMICKHCEAVGHTSPHEKSSSLTPRK